MKNNISFFADNVFTSTTLAPSASITTTDTFTLGKSETQGLDWDLASSGAINLHIELLQSNSPSGPFTKWGSPNAAGVNVTNDLTVTTTVDGTSLSLSPSGHMKIKLTNNSAASLTINRFTLFEQ